jgi:hypothetical protein
MWIVRIVIHAMRQDLIKNAKYKSPEARMWKERMKENRLRAIATLNEVGFIYTSEMAMREKERKEANERILGAIPVNQTDEGRPTEGSGD